MWRAVNDALELDRRDLALLHEASRALDRLDKLDRQLRVRGLLLPDGRIQPAAVEARQQAIALARVLAAMRLPEDLSNPEVRPQRRAGVRGIYTIKRREGSL